MKKLILTFLFALLIVPLFTSVHAQDSALPGIDDHAGAMDDCAAGDWSVNCTAGYTKASEMWTMACFLGDVDACTKIEEDKIPYLRNSVLGMTTGTIGYMYENMPANTSQFIAYYGQKLAITKPAYAQGIGFAGLSPLLPLWRGTRNIAYGFTIVMMIAAGFMIIFRVKIDPRTVISIQMALPRVILTLILITFSYAIVGLMIDLMYLLIFLCITLVGTITGSFTNLTGVLTEYTGGGLWSMFGATFTSGNESIRSFSDALGGGLGTGATTALLTLLGLTQGAGTAIAVFSLSALGIAGSGGGNPLVALLIWLALAFTFIRILVTLINAYIQVIVAVIFGPLQIMFDAIPNSSAFNNWFRGLIANLSVFAIVPIMLLLSTVISDRAVATGGLWSPPGLAGFGNKDALSAIIGIGFAFVIPTVANSIKELLKVKPVVPTGAGAVLSPISSVYGTVTGGMSQMYYFTQLKGMFGGGRSAAPPPPSKGGGSGGGH